MSAPKRTILLLEDSREILKANKRILELLGYAVQAAESIGEARKLVAKHMPDLCVLDIMLPDGSGLSFCAELRSFSDVPILFLTALNEKDDIVVGLRRGGDDYLTKPYEVEVLLARIDALLRRVAHMEEKVSRQGKLPKVVGVLTIDYKAERVFRNGDDVSLKPREFALFRLLLERRGEYIKPVALFETAWGVEANGDLRTVYAHISNLRRKLESEGGGLVIEHNRMMGYRLMADC